MSAVLDFPPIEPPPLIEQPKPAAVAVVEPAALVPVSIKDAVLAQFKDAEKDVLALVEKYRAVAFDVSTTKGMAEAKAARLELREKGRYAITRAETAVKADVNGLKKVMAEEVERIVALVLPTETAIDEQIKAEEKRKADAKAEKERIEAERVAAHQAGIAKVRAYLTHCQAPGMTAERIAKGIDMLAVVTFGPEWQEFAEQATTAQAETLAAMRALHAQAVDREAAAAQAEADRIEREAEQARQAAENARVAAELAEQKRALEVQAAELAERERLANAEKERVAALSERVAAIHARAAEIEGARAWDIFQAVVALEDLDVSEAAFQEFAPMAADARRLVLAAMLKAKDEAEAREAAEAAAKVAAGPAAAADAEDVCPTFVDDGAPIQPDEPIEVLASNLDAGPDEFVPAAVDPINALIDCRAALTEALEMVQRLVNSMDQTKGGDLHARTVLARVSALRTLGGI